MNRQTNILPAVLAGLALVALSAAAGAATYEIDKAHSSVSFKVRHLGVSNTKGNFEEFQGSFAFDPADPASWKAAATIQVASVNTDDAKRDEHLRSSDFFDVANHPTMTFQSTGVTKNADGTYQLQGDLTLRGVTKPVTLALEVLGTVTDPWGNARAGFAATGKINRKDFGVSWHKALDNGGLVVGDEVTILLEIEGILKR